MQTPQHELFYPSWQDCIRDISRLLGRGGDAKLAGLLWPTKPVTTATSWLRDCLDPNRSAKLDPDEFIALLRIGREHGYHGLMFHVADEAAYSRPTPITPEDIADEARRQVFEATKQLKRAIDVLERQAISARGAA